MKKILSILLLFSSVLTYAQDVNIPIGDPTIKPNSIGVYKFLVPRGTVLPRLVPKTGTEIQLVPNQQLQDSLTVYRQKIENKLDLVNTFSQFATSKATSIEYDNSTWERKAGSVLTSDAGYGARKIPGPTGFYYERKIEGIYEFRWYTNYWPSPMDGNAMIVNTAWDKVKADMPLEGGILKFASGRFRVNNNWELRRSNMTIRGEGKDATILDAPYQNGGVFAFAPYRDAGWIIEPELLYTYEDTAAIAQGYISLKQGQDMTAFVPGTAFFINAGASYNDQNFGEFNMVDRVVGNKIYLKYNLGRDYTTARSSWYGILAQDFTPPPVGETAVAVFASGPPSDVSVRSISILNDLYRVVAVSGNSVTLRNLGKGNVSSVFPAGTKVYRQRAIILTPSTVKNTVIEDLTIEGRRGGITISNTIATQLNRVRIVRLPSSIQGGLWLDGDDGRDFTMQNCEVYCPNEIFGSQLARSFGQARFINTIFNNASLAIHEFTFDVLVQGCNWHLYRSSITDNFPWAAIFAGQTCSNIKIVQNTFTLDNVSAAISSSDIQEFRGLSQTGFLVQGNTFKLNRVSAAIAINRVSGMHNISDNQIFGDCGAIFSSGSIRPNKTNESYVRDTGTDRQTNVFTFGADMVIKNNQFVGTTNSVGIMNENIVHENNRYFRQGKYSIGNDVTSISYGTVIVAAVPTQTTTSPYQIISKNNIYSNWHFDDKSYLGVTGQLRGGLIDVSNELFLNPSSTSIRKNTFVYNLQDKKAITNYSPVEIGPYLKNSEVDMLLYRKQVEDAGGLLTNAEIVAVRSAVDSLYKYNLRDKIEYLSTFTGDSLAAKVPVFGWHKSRYKRFESSTLTGLDYSKSLGWKGNTTKSATLSTLGDLGLINDISISVQLTSPSSLTVQSFIAGANGGAGSSQYSISVTYGGGNSTLRMLGAAPVINNQPITNGFYSSSQKASSQINYLDIEGRLDFTNNNFQTTLNGSSTLPIDILNSTDVSIGSFVIGRSMTLVETRQLRTILKKLMTDLGRPVQP